MEHLVYDLRNVLRRIDSSHNRTILVTRTEFLWKDWYSSHEWFMGGINQLPPTSHDHYQSPPPTIYTKRNSSSIEYPITSKDLL